MHPEPDEPDINELWNRLADEGVVPKEFYSEYLSGPFLRCIDCECELLSGREAYSVVKSYVGRETVFEMAICAHCSMNLAASYSDHSKAAFEKSMQEWKTERRRAADPESTRRPTTPLVEADVAQLDACAGCGRSRADCRRYSIVGAFVGRSLVSPVYAHLQLPILVCDECNSAVSENISRQTRDTWDRFVEDHFDGPPGIELDSPRLDPILI